MSPTSEPAARDRAILRHILATLAYRGGKAIRDAPAGFADFRPTGAFNTPLALLVHIGDLIRWAHRWLETGDQKTYQVSEPLHWDTEITRFHGALEDLDRLVLAAPSDEPLRAPLETLIQSALADALTHIGQLLLLRRMAGDPVPGEPYRQAQIVAGRLGPAQVAPAREFERDKGALWIPPTTSLPSDTGSS